MDSRTPRPDLAPRGLGPRHRLRLLAVALWTGFLGGALTLLSALALLPDDIAPHLGWAELSVAFLCAWAVAAVTALLALTLADPSDGR